jgi:hypothetical protein
MSWCYYIKDFQFQTGQTNESRKWEKQINLKKPTSIYIILFEYKNN